MTIFHQIPCMHIEGKIPFKSAKDHQIAFLWSRSTLNNFSSSTYVKDVEIIISKVEDFPKYAYLKWLGNGFYSNCDGFSNEGINLYVFSPKDS